MAVDYTLWLTNPTGERIAVLAGDAAAGTNSRGWLSLDYMGSVNTYTALNVRLAGDAIPWHWLVRDARLEAYRAIDGGLPYLDMERSWLLRYREKTISLQGERTISVQALDPKYLLAGPIIAYDAGSPQAQKTAPLDDMMKALVRENLGSLATDSSRNLGSYLSVEANTSQAPSTTKAFARRPLLAVLQELASASAELGTRLSFDVVWTGSTYEFRTYTRQRGLDHRSTSGSPVAIGPDVGNLTNVSVADDWRNEITYVYAGGRGLASDRLLVMASDAARIAASPFGRREAFVDDTRYSSGAGLTAEAQAHLYAGRPRTTFKGQLQETALFRYGVQWRWGDALTASIDGEVFDCRADTVRVSVQAGKETIECWLEGER
jgi:hypothetical protein